ncbi:MAG: NADH-ubiquinone oxidoreductase-F iron-sulfur binding region domain-containing protein [bacterium]
MKPEHWLLPEKPYATYQQYLAENRPSAVAEALAREPSELVAELSRSGLRGRGGAGSPTGLKWRAVAEHAASTRVVVMNAVESEPGSFKDRYLVRFNPYAALEGLRIAAHIVGARDLYVATRARFRAEIDRLRDAVRELSSDGVFDGVRLTIVEGPEEYLLGEEKALLNYIEEGQPLPREAHQTPVERGLFASVGSPNPALVSNIETFARVPGIVRAGADSFRALGTTDTAGTILFTVSGDVTRPGVYELEAGTPLKHLLYDVAGGPRPWRRLKLVLPGLSGGVITPERFDTPADFGSLALIGAALGSGGFIAYDDTRNVPRIASSLARFFYVESCNQCPACKQGLRLASSAIDELFDSSKATHDDPERALYGARSAPQGHRCFLPVQGATVIPSLISRFRGEFEARYREPLAPTEAVPVPLLVDYVAATRSFALDESYVRKRPDWTYAPPVPSERADVEARPESLSGALGVRLAPDLAEALRKQADREGVDLDRLVDRLLRQRS